MSDLITLFYLFSASASVSCKISYMYVLLVDVWIIRDFSSILSHLLEMTDLNGLVICGIFACIIYFKVHRITIMEVYLIDRVLGTFLLNSFHLRGRLRSIWRVISDSWVLLWDDFAWILKLGFGLAFNYGLSMRFKFRCSLSLHGGI